MIEINGKVYRNLQEQVEKNKEDIEDLQQGITVDVYTKAESDAKFQTKADMSDYATKIDLNSKQDTLIAGDNITIQNNVISTKVGTSYSAGNNIIIDSSNEISVATNPIFENVSIDNDYYYSNNYQGTVIEYNESGDNDSGWIKMNGNNPELYAYNDHLHGEYGNSSRIRMLEDIQVHKSGWSNYPDGQYDITYNLIDTLEDHANKLNNTVQLTFTFSGGTTQTYDVVIKPSNNS